MHKMTPAIKAKEAKLLYLIICSQRGWLRWSQFLDSTVVINLIRLCVACSYSVSYALPTINHKNPQWLHMLWFAEKWTHIHILEIRHARLLRPFSTFLSQLRYTLMRPMPGHGSTLSWLGDMNQTGTTVDVSSSSLQVAPHDRQQQKTKH